MTQIFNEAGQQIPVTVVEATRSRHQGDDEGIGGLCRGRARLRRAAVAPAEQEGEREPRGSRANKAAIGHALKAGLAAAPRVLRSVRLDDAQGKNPEIPTYSVGDMITVGIFAPGDTVKVTGTTKGRGFQGVVKRYGFHGGPNTHGNTSTAARLDRAGHQPVARHQGQEDAGALRRRAPHADQPPRREGRRGSQPLVPRGAVAGPKNGIVLVRKQG